MRILVDRLELGAQLARRQVPQLQLAVRPILATGGEQLAVPADGQRIDPERESFEDGALLRLLGKCARQTEGQRGQDNYATAHSGNIDAHFPPPKNLGCSQLTTLDRDDRRWIKTSCTACRHRPPAWCR